jgi:hypothetical protein
MDTPRLLIVPIATAAFLALGACSTADVPHVAMLPGPNSDMARFNTDDIECRKLARAIPVSRPAPPAVPGMGSGDASIPGKAASEGGGDMGSSFGGTLVPDSGDAPTERQRYDTAYIRCMFSRGHKVPVGDGLTASAR